MSQFFLLILIDGVLRKLCNLIGKLMCSVLNVLFLSGKRKVTYKTRRLLRTRFFFGEVWADLCRERGRTDGHLG